MKEARAAWFERFGGVRLDQLVFLDEFGATTDMARRRARGAEAVAAVTAADALAFVRHCVYAATAK